MATRGRLQLVRCPVDGGHGNFAVIPDGSFGEVIGGLELQLAVQKLPPHLRIERVVFRRQKLRQVHVGILFPGRLVGRQEIDQLGFLCRNGRERC
jgi:hypothetical protein